MASERARQRRRLSRSSARLRHAEIQQDLQRERALAKCGIGAPARDAERWYADARASCSVRRVDGSWFIRRGEDAALSWRRWSEAWVDVDPIAARASAAAVSPGVTLVRNTHAAVRGSLQWLRKTGPNAAR